MEFYVVMNVTVILFCSVRGFILKPFNVSKICNAEISSLVADLSRKYFSHFRCFVLITDDTSETLLQTFKPPPYTPVLQGQVVQEDYMDPKLKMTVELAYSQYCKGFIIQTTQPVRFLKTLQSVTRTSVYRVNPRLLFVPSLHSSTISFDLFSTKELEFFPDVLVVDLKINHSEGSAINNTGSSAWFKLSTIDWETNSTVLAECKLQQCLDIDFNLYPNKVKNLKGKSLTLSAITYPPYTILEPYFEGLDFNIVREYGQKHNCSWTIIKPPKGQRWGYTFDNGTGTGVFGQVASAMADVGIGGNYADHQMYKYLSLTTAYVKTGITFLVPRPKMISNWHLPFMPFKIFTWITLLFMLVSVTITLIISNKILSYLDKSIRPTHHNCDNIHENYHAVLNTVMDIFRLVVLQSSTFIVKIPTPVWQLFTGLQLMFVVVIAYYSSRIAAVLTVPRYQRSIENVQDLVDSGIEWGDVDDSYLLYLKLSDGPLDQQLVKQNKVLTAEQLLARALSRDFAFLLGRLSSGYLTVFENMTEEAAKLLMVMKEDTNYDLNAIVLRKASPFLDSFNNLIQQIIDTGLHFHWEAEVTRKYLDSRLQDILKYSNFKTTDNGPTVLLTSHIVGTFILLLVGLSVSFIVFLVEIFY